MVFVQKLWQWFKRKRLGIVDAILIVVLIAGAFYGYKNMDRYEFSFAKTLNLSNPWLVKTDSSGNSYAVDKERSRIVVIDRDRQVSRIVNGNASEGDTFFYPDNIYVDNEGGIYIHDIQWSPSGFSLDGECIMYYTPDGKFDRYVYEVKYDEIYCDKHRLFALTEYDGLVYFIAADEKGFVLNSVSPSGGEVSELAVFSLEDAITLIQDFAFDPVSRVIYAVDKRGLLLEAANGTVTQVRDVYKNVAGEEKIALFRAAADDNGSVYVTDIAANRLLCFSRENGYNYSQVSAGSAIWNVAVNNENSQISFIKEGQIYVLDSSGKVILEGSEFAKSPELLRKEGLLDLSLLLAALAGLYLLLRIFSLIITFKYSENQRIGVLVAVSILIVTAIIVGQLMGEFRKTYRDEIIKKLEMSAQIVSNTTDLEALKGIKTPRDYLNDDYKKLLSSINNTLNKNFEYCDDMYCNILKYDGEKAFAMAYIDNSIGAYYPLFGAEAEEVRQIYMTGNILHSNSVSETGSYIYAKVPIYDKDSEVTAVVEVGTLSDVLTSSVNAMIRKIVIPFIMLILVILFAFSEIFSFFDLRSKYKQEARTNKRTVPLHVVRLLVFVTFMAFNMATSFLPIYILKFAGKDWGITRELAASIPMSVNLVFIGITSLFCARLLGIFGFRPVAALSACIAFGGDLILALAHNYTMIIAGLALNGLGVGIITNSIHMFIASSKFGENKDNGYGFSIYNAASLSGINVGLMFGAALAVNLGQSNVFLVSTVVWFGVAFIFFLLGRNITVIRAEEGAEEHGSMSLRQFILNKNVLRFMAFIQIPYIAMSSFTYYYVPIFVNSQGLGENESCMMIMISSLFSVYLSVVLTGYLGNKIKHSTIYLSSLITYAALIVFALHMSVPMLIVSLIMIGIANSFGSTSRVDFFTSSEEANAYGQDRAMGIYNFVDNIGESAGPVLLGGIISSGFLAGIIKLVGIFAGLNSLFALSRLRHKKSDKITVKM